MLGTKCASCQKFFPKEQTKIVLSSNGKMKVRRCLACIENRRKRESVR